MLGDPVSMNELKPRNTTILADLGPLPEVVESDTETCWHLFQQLQAQPTCDFTLTESAALAPAATAARAAVTVEDVMVEARRMNRVCPKDGPWLRLFALLRESAGAEPPAPIVAPESTKTPQLVRRVRFRDQVEWADRHGQLPLMFGFIQRLVEDEWAHMRG